MIRLKKKGNLIVIVRSIRRRRALSLNSIDLQRVISTPLFSASSFITYRIHRQQLTHNRKLFNDSFLSSLMTQLLVLRKKKFDRRHKKKKFTRRKRSTDVVFPPFAVSVSHDR